jgi:hypothetical protein
MRAFVAIAVLAACLPLLEYHLAFAIALLAFLVLPHVRA